MKSIEDVRQELSEQLAGLAEAEASDSEVQFHNAVNLLGLEGFAEDIHELCLAMDQKATIVALSGLMSGNLDRTEYAHHSAIFMGFAIGYKLGCSHTAERMP